MNEIETSVVSTSVLDSAALAPENQDLTEPETHMNELAKHINTLFVEFGKRLSQNNPPETPKSVDLFTLYEESYQRSLDILWDAVSRKLDYPALLSDADEVRAWFNDPANAGQ